MYPYHQFWMSGSHGTGPSSVCVQKGTSWGLGSLFPFTGKIVQERITQTCITLNTQEEQQMEDLPTLF